ncbi:5-methyltetrahydrofolate--homocysteine methyltransferase [Erysipelatoclostridium sp. An15]|uniref:corrinoid protein n=1 Tax=Erysipelatoclostridium sp. An15 TaxID=1965566 RepID=UPI000B395685|nr:corrinoid protein [Erysipelatoclostridium sp. An15]OUQ07106.1 5-methyltetrahydrofolate--homocysteine methyltransferase [Erysipelatoclostridium sp. An15]
MDKLSEIKELMQQGRAKNVVTLVQEALDEGIEANVILNDALLAGMAIIGDKFKQEEIFVPEVLVAARAMNKGVEVLKPYLQDSSNISKGTAVLGTVKGDLHDIGKNLVRIMMEGKGIDVIDLGTDISAETFIDEAKKNHADIICCSALLTTTMPEMKRVVDLVKAENLDVKVMIGGAPVNQEFCDEIGADYYTDDAASAADVAASILEGRAC